MKKVVIGGLVVMLVLMVIGYLNDPVETREVTAGEWGEKWPFTFDHGALKCVPVGEDAAAVVIEAPDRKLYWVNGAGKATFDGSLGIEPVRRADPRPGRSNIDIGPIIKTGYQLCGQEL